MRRHRIVRSGTIGPLGSEAAVGEEGEEEQKNKEDGGGGDGVPEWQRTVHEYVSSNAMFSTAAPRVDDTESDTTLVQLAV